ncbi:MAG TPA: tetratricopeptide repeat protein [Pyrinomonadaceae bacterium]|nr:tetratricopeptide repeat protein [Pyrinomonadaceae bacterium]
MSNTLAIVILALSVMTTAVGQINEGVSALDRGDKTKAKVIFEQTLKSDPRNVDAHTYLGMIAAEANDLNEAERHFAAAATLAPSEPSTRNNYGAILMRLGRTAQAQAEFEASLKLNPNQPNALTNLAQMYFDRGQLDDLRMARSLLERAGKNSSDAEIPRALLVTRLKLGQVLIEKGFHDEAIAELKTALPTSADPIVTAQIYATLAEVYEADGHYENAIPAMRLAVQRDPQNEIYHFRYGLLLTDSHAPAAGILRLQEALKQFPNSARLWLALGIAQLTYGQNAEAENSFKQSLALDAKLVPALAYLGMTYSERGVYQKAIDFYEQAITLNPQLAALHYLVAETILKSSDADTTRAEKYLRRATELDPNLAPAYLTWGRLYVRANRYSEAAPLLERAVSLQPELLEAHYQLSRVLVKLKRTDEANRELAIFKELSEKQKARNESREIVRRLANVKF